MRQRLVPCPTQTPSLLPIRCLRAPSREQSTKSQVLFQPLVMKRRLEWMEEEREQLPILHRCPVRCLYPRFRLSLDCFRSLLAVSHLIFSQSLSTVSCSLCSLSLFYSSLPDLPTFLSLPRSNLGCLWRTAFYSSYR